MNVKEVIIKAIEDAVFLLNDEYETVMTPEIAERYEVVLKDLQKALEKLHKLEIKGFIWTNSLN
jgi:hypothetical protein